MRKPQFAFTAYRKVIAAIVQKDRGRVVDFSGESILVEFAGVASAVQSAVQSAVGIQEVVRAKKAELSEHRRTEFRIGICLGGVIQQGERIYGDGVNIAVRVEGLAGAGGNCISG
jgi:adenylate cyclase